MPLVKISPKHQVVIPKKIFEHLNLAPGDLVDVSLEDNYIVVKPKKVVDPEDAWFYSKETQADLRQALKEVSEGKVGPPLKTRKQLKDFLDSLKK